MRIKIIAAIFICFYSSLSFSQTKKVLYFFEKSIAVSEGNGKCFGNIYRQGQEHYSISLFSDSTFIISYSRTGNLFPVQHELATGKFFKKDVSVYLIRESAITKFSKTPQDGGKLEEVFNIGIPVRIEYSDENMSFYNSAGSFLTFRKENIIKKYRDSKPAKVLFPVNYISYQFSSNTKSF